MKSTTAQTALDKKPLGLFAVFYDGETRPVAGFVLREDAERFAKEHGSGEVTYEIKHVHVTDASVPALPSDLQAAVEEIRERQRLRLRSLQANDLTIVQFFPGTPMADCNTLLSIIESLTELK